MLGCRVDVVRAPQLAQSAQPVELRRVDDGLADGRHHDVAVDVVVDDGLLHVLLLGLAEEPPPVPLVIVGSSRRREPRTRGSRGAEGDVELRHGDLESAVIELEDCGLVMDVVFSSGHDNVILTQHLVTKQ